MTIRRSFKARLYIFKSHLKWLLGFTLIYTCLSVYYVSNIDLLYPSNILVSYRDATRSSDSIDDVVSDFNSKLSSLDFLEQLRTDLGYKYNFNEFQIIGMKFKIFLGKFLPHNLTPNTWTFDDDFLRKTATWESLSNSIKLTATKHTSTFEILCLSTRPINSQAICEKAIYALSTNYLESKKNILIENIDLYKRDASLLSEGESLEDYKKRLTRVERQTKNALGGAYICTNLGTISELSCGKSTRAVPSKFLTILVIYHSLEVVYRIIIHSSDYIYFARHVNEKTNIEIKRSFNGHLDQFYSNTFEKDKNYERCMLHLKSILWTIEHESKEK